MRLRHRAPSFSVLITRKLCHRPRARTRSRRLPARCSVQPIPVPARRLFLATLASGRWRLVCMINTQEWNSHMTTNNRSSRPLPKGITELTGQDIPHDQVDLGYRGTHHSAFITDQSRSNGQPVCGLFLTVWPNYDGDPEYRYIEELDLHEVESLIPLLEVVRVKLRELSNQTGGAR